MFGISNVMNGKSAVLVDRQRKAEPENAFPELQGIREHIIPITDIN